MKLTRILPKFLAKTYQEEDLRRAETHLQYHRGMARVFEERVTEGRAELERLRRIKWDVEFVKFHIRTLVDFNHGKKNKYVEFVMEYVNIFLGMEIIYMNIGEKEIELS